MPHVLDGEVLAAGVGWCWILSAETPVHLAGPDAPRGPLTLCLEEDPQCPVGSVVHMDVPGERWHAPALPTPAPPTQRRATLAALEPHLEPVLGASGSEPMVDLIARHGGRGPGLTPEGDDFLMGVIAARRALGRRDECDLLADWAEKSAGEPSRSLLIHATQGEIGEPAQRVLSALLLGGPADALAALPELLAWGATSGRALLTGLCCGLRA